MVTSTSYGFDAGRHVYGAGAETVCCTGNLPGFTGSLPLVHRHGLIGERVSLALAVGRTTRCVMGNRASGWAKYAPLRRGRGGAAGMPPGTAKNAGMDAGIFGFFSALDHGERAAPPPLSG
ncbi:MAG: hypothetical protein LBT01_00690 [Spirochaetaceae bacterium]|nr:hypothetical protein [Spirochaetaceae bacterium]